MFYRNVQIGIIYIINFCEEQGDSIKTERVTSPFSYNKPNNSNNNHNSKFQITLFIPDVRPEIIPMLPEQLGEKTDMEKKCTWCVSNLIFSATT